MTNESFNEIKKERLKTEADLVKSGAEYVRDNEEDDGRLEVTAGQRAMAKHLMFKELKRISELNGTLKEIDLDNFDGIPTYKISLEMPILGLKRNSCCVIELSATRGHKNIEDHESAELIIIIEYLLKNYPELNNSESVILEGCGWGRIIVNLKTMEFRTLPLNW